MLYLRQIAFTFLVYPALILAYMGQAAYLSKHHETNYQISFFVSVPGIRLSVLFFLLILIKAKVTHDVQVTSTQLHVN